ncbi:putative nucleotidyltransferase component of viral defense system [Roseateles asaccharophilus]|uniref:nucleotidyl transferase AbiEii/AbiGii toxin family protein n=1 Tax=Roseateles asaccharophilus TaxID=582607 RepID=UPI00383274CF
MTKIAFNQEQQLDLTRRLQLMLLEAVMASGTWVQDDIRFQGGTCLSLVHGSSRFSEDLDFVIGTDRGLARVLSAAEVRMGERLRLALPGAQVKFSARDDDIESLDAKNPRTFMMTVSHPDWHRAVKVKVEFWVANPEAVAKYEARTLPARLLTQVVEGVPLRVTLAPVLVRSAETQEILVDKLHALACRSYMKHRDVYDLWWLSQSGQQLDWCAELKRRYDYHAEMYNDSPTLPALGQALAAKADEIAAMAGDATFSQDLKKWLGAKDSLATQASADVIATQVAQQLRELALQLSAERSDDHQALASPSLGGGLMTAPAAPPAKESFLAKWTRVINDANPPGVPLIDPRDKPSRRKPS